MNLKEPSHPMPYFGLGELLMVASLTLGLWTALEAWPPIIAGWGGLLASSVLFWGYYSVLHGTLGKQAQ